MGLTFSLEKVSYHKRLFEKEMIINNQKLELKEPFKAIILLSIVVGMNKITSENYEVFYNRVNVIEKLKGSMLIKVNGKRKTPQYIKLKDVKRLIGLQTNACELTKTQFLKKQFKGIQL